MRLTPKNAEKFATELFKQNLKGIQLEFRLKQCKEVQKVCLLLAENKEVNIKALKITAWLHDIGRVDDGDLEHPAKSLELAKNQFKKIDEIIEDCIINHAAKSKPKTKEGRLFQLADKLSLLSPQLFIESLKDNKEGAINFFSENFTKLLELSRNFDFHDEVKEKAKQEVSQ